MKSARTSLCLVAALACGACGGSGSSPLDAGSDAGLDGGSDAGDAGAHDTGAGDAGSLDAGGGYLVAPHLPFPQMPGHGGAPMSRLQLVTVTFTGYPYKAAAEGFGDFVGNSNWLKAITQDYGPIPVTSLGNFVLDVPGASGSSAFGPILAQAIAQGKLPHPADQTGLLYLVYAPPPCGSGGYHGLFLYNGKGHAFAVALNCGDGSDPLAPPAVMSHEIGEALTDTAQALPDGGYVGGLYFDDAQAPWIGEVGDICNESPWWEEGGYRFLGIWSNKAAADGGSPCVPYPSHAYDNVTPAEGSVQTADAGSSATFTLTGWSTAPTSAWGLQVQPDSYGGGDFDTAPALSASTIKNGTSVTLTLHVPAGTPPGKQATVRVKSNVSDQPEGVSGFSNDWSLQIRSR